MFDEGTGVHGNTHFPFSDTTISIATTGGFLLVQTALSNARQSTALVHTFFLKARLR